jgi:mannosyl-3-phosphoglycerate phosphatase
LTDIDGTLLDRQSYSYEASLPAIRRLLRLKVPLVLCSSKTHAEVRPLWDELGLRDPFIVENGGAILLPPNYFPFAAGVATREGWTVSELGKDVAFLRQALRNAERDCGARVRSFGTMTATEIAAVTGLTLEQSRRAIQRAYDEPFLVDDENFGCVTRHLKQNGLAVVKGDRFYHVCADADKGKAVSILLDLYRRITPDLQSIGLGNSANDLSLLAAVDYPVLVRNFDGSWDVQVENQIPDILKSTEIGPHGWNEMLDKILGRRSETEK